METLWLYCVVTAVCFQFVPIIGDGSHNVKTVTKLACPACERLSTRSPRNQEIDLINKKQSLRSAQKTASATDRAPDGSPSKFYRDSSGERQTRSPHKQEKDLVRRKQPPRPKQKTAPASSTDRAPAASPAQSNSDSSGERRPQSPHNQQKDQVKEKQPLRPPQKTAPASSGPAVHASSACASNSISDSTGEHRSPHSGQQGVQNAMVPTCTGLGLGAGYEGTTQGAGASSNPLPPQNDSGVFVPIPHENPGYDSSHYVSDEDEKMYETYESPNYASFDLENSKSTAICENDTSVSSLDTDKEDVVNIM